VRIFRDGRGTILGSFGVGSPEKIDVEEIEEKAATKKG